MTEGAAAHDLNEPETRLAAPGTHDRRYDLLLVAAMVLLYLPLIFVGYGLDNDTFLVLDSGRSIVERRTYVPSRPPGYALYETAVGVLDKLGGHVLSNAVTLAFGAVCVSCFLQICRHLGVPRPSLLACLLIVHPVFWTSSTLTMDYVWALAMLLGGCLLLLRRSYLLAGLALGLAIGTRATSCVAAALLLAFPLVGRPGDRGRVVAAGLIAVVVGAVFYIPPFRHAGDSLAFLTPTIGDPAMRTIKLRAGRFVYKSIYFWGLLGTLALPVLLLLSWKNLTGTAWRRVAACCAAVVGAYLLLFFQFPVELQYLLPALPAVLILLGIGLTDRPMVLSAFGVVLASYALVNVNIARPDRPDNATGAAVGLWVEPGLVLKHAQRRAALRHCRTTAEWMATTGYVPPTQPAGRPAP